MTENEKEIYYFIGDAFSVELLDFLNSNTKLKLIPLTLNQEFSLEKICGIIYTPSLNHKEISVLKKLPSRVKRIAVLDLFHFDFCDFISSFQKMPPDLVLSPRELPCKVKEIVIIPSLIKLIYSKSKDQEPTNLQDVCFISQPLQEERILDFNQYELAIKCRETLQEIAPNRKFFIKPHPRENITLFKDLVLYNQSPLETLKHFKFFVGYNSAMLYAAQGLKRNVQMYSHMSCVTPKKMQELFLECQQESLPAIEFSLDFFINKLFK